MRTWRDYDEEYETNIDWTCENCDITYEDVEVTVHGNSYIVTCDECGYEGNREVSE